ncbi:unnamed protein product [Closterium sp. Yama58-4]|nr:unnamed protein product [Closterium sp. Yama58-4]
MLTTGTDEDEAAEEAGAAPAPVPDEVPEETRARYVRTSGFRADDVLWHQRLGHPSRATLKNCIDAGVFTPRALLRPDGTEVRGATHPRNCTVCPEAALSHQPFPLLEPGTNRYPKLHKVYSDFLNVGHCGVDDELYTLTDIDAGTRYVWVANVESRDRANQVFRLWLAHAQRQSGEKLKIWQSDGAAEFPSKQTQDYLAQKGIEHHISLPYAHQQQGVAERTNRTLMTKVRALMKQSKLPPIYWTYSMHHAMRVHNLLSTTAITGNLSPHVKWTGTKGDTSMLRFRHDEQTNANANRIYANDGHSYTTPDKAAASILEQDTRGEFTWGDFHRSDDHNDSSGGGMGGAGGSDKGAAQPAPPEPESDDDDVQEVIPQRRHDSTVSGLQLLGLHTATSKAPRVIEPRNLRQALSGPHSKEWHEAMDAEIKALGSRDTWVLVDRAAIKGARVLSANRHTSVRILLAIAATRHLPLRRIDVKNAFMYALVDAVIYVEQPHTYGGEDSHMPHDPGMYRRDFRGKYILLTVYVDDLFYTGSSNELLEQFEKSVVGRVDITCNYEVKQFLGLNISYAPEAIHLSAAKYAEELGKRFNISPAPLSTLYRTPRPNHKPDNKALSPAGVLIY